MAVSCSRDPIPPIGRRGHARVRLNLPVLFITIDGNKRCLLENLSVSGARLAVPQPIARGASGFLKLDTLELFGTVAWATRTHCGIEFDELLPEAALLAMRELAERYPEIERQQNLAQVRDWVAGQARTMRNF